VRWRKDSTFFLIFSSLDLLKFLFHSLVGGNLHSSVFWGHSVTLDFGRGFFNILTSQTPVRLSPGGGRHDSQPAGKEIMSLPSNSDSSAPLWFQKTRMFCVLIVWQSSLSGRQISRSAEANQNKARLGPCVGPT
jgi:hypothetical protein